MGRDPHPFYVPPSEIVDGGIVRFSDQEARHITRVIRLKPGDRCRIVDGEGGSYLVLLRQNGERLEGSILEKHSEGRPAKTLELGFPLLKARARTEWLIEKAVEVGVDVLVPILWSRSVKRELKSARERWDRILREAMKQSERSWLPRLSDLEEPTGEATGPMMLLADPGGDETIPDLSNVETVRLFIGPEGGLEADERNKLLERGAKLWSLGPARLRAETAAIVGSHRLRCALGNDRRE